MKKNDESQNSLDTKPKTKQEDGSIPQIFNIIHDFPFKNTNTSF